MRKNKAKTFTIIRKNGSKYMTQTSRNYSLRDLPELLQDGIAFLKTMAGKLQALFGGAGNRHYVALSSRRMHGGIQMGRR